MPHLTSLNLSANSPKQPVSALARKRQNLLRKPSIEVGDIADLVETLQTIRSAVLAGELDKALEAMIKEKPVGNAKK